MNPYQNLESRAFWAPSVGKLKFSEISDLWRPKFDLGKDLPVSTYGSCFAQHIGKALKSRGFNWFNAEPAPPHLSNEDALAYNYGIFSSRTANIYTTTLLLQWLNWSQGGIAQPKEVWQDETRYYDPFRPTIEPGGFASRSELEASRDLLLERFAVSIRQAGLFVFTLGLTESWVDAETGVEYPMCPGTVAGEFDAGKHKFVNQKTSDIYKALDKSISIIREMNPEIKILLTVSPVPLTATMSQDHVLVATSNSKARLRAVAGEMKEAYDFVDYFPSYEIITAPPFGGRFYADNQRSVLPEGVEFVMDHFFHGLGEPLQKTGEVVTKEKESDPDDETAADDVVCEEKLLEAFRPR